MAYKQVILYTMSGTGNTYRVAAWVAEEAGKQATPAQIIPCDAGCPQGWTPDRARDLVGVLMPAHGFTAPWAMIRFALGMPRGNGTHAFTATSRGGSRPFGQRLPGMEGTAGYLIALILALKGYRVRGVQGFDMASNWTSLHPGMSRESIEIIESHTYPRVERFIQRILSGKTAFGSFVSLFLGLLLLPISVLYLLVGRFFLAKLFFANNQCNGCGLCAESCPHHAIRMWGDRPFWTYSCESCMRCMAYCPQQAVEAGHSWGVLLYFILAIPVSTYALNWLDGYVPGLADLNGTMAWYVLQYPYWLLATLAAYAVFARLIKVRPVNALFTWTTLTHFYRRYHQPETRLKDLTKE